MNMLSLILISTCAFSVLAFDPSGFVRFSVPKNIIHSLPLKYTVQPTLPILMSTDASSSNEENIGVGANVVRTRSFRATMRATTGFSLTTFRATMRAATGISLSAIYLSIIGFTSGLVRDAMKIILSVLPTSFRYFLQPFLVLYFFPLFLLRTWTSPSLRRERRDLKAALKEDWNRGVEAAEAKLDESFPEEEEK